VTVAGAVYGTGSEYVVVSVTWTICTSGSRPAFRIDFSMKARSYFVCSTEVRRSVRTSVPRATA
jgi:hypothetical protein